MNKKEKGEKKRQDLSWKRSDLVEGEKGGRRKEGTKRRGTGHQ